jgi:hypothetical protein
VAGKSRGGWIVTTLALSSCAGALGFALHHFTQRGVESPITDPIDFRAFYCGAVVAAAHADPYRSEPLRSCEAAATLAAGFQQVPGLVVPAPLPGYAFALLSPLAHLPILLASAIWLVLGFAAVVATIVLVTRMTNVRPLWIALALVFSEGLASLLLGQLVPFVTAALCACAYALRSGRPALAAVCAAAAMIEPHLGLPASLALFVWVPVARRALTACAAVLAALSIAFLGLPANVEYFTVVLPAHAHSEVASFAGQYSLSALLYRIGVAAPAALRLAELSYVAMLALGVWLGKRCAVAFDDPAFVPLVPVALALVGGPFVHIHQMAAAIPAAFLLYAHLPAQRQTLRWALVFLAIPWETIAETNGIAQALGLFAHHEYEATLVAVSDGGRIAEDVWEAWANNANVPTLRATLESAAIKLPTWIALAIVARAAFLAPVLTPRPALRAAETAARPPARSASPQAARPT